MILGQMVSEIRETDGQIDRQKVMHMSPTCISTGVFNKALLKVRPLLPKVRACLIFGIKQYL